jgi:predicted dehydrogenase
MKRVIGIGFDHMHMGDQLRTAVAEPAADLVAVVDEDAERMASVCRSVDLAELPQVTGPPGSAAVEEALDRYRPEVAVVCSTTARHRDWVEVLAPRGIAVQLEKPFAPSLADADAMIAAADRHGSTLAVNWPLAWYPTHRTAQRLIAEGAVGTVTEVHFYDGNRGPLYHLHDKIEVQPTEADKAGSWWYAKAAGGGSLLDYLGYGTTLGTWFRGGELPRSVTATTHVAPGIEVDEQSVVVAAYATGLSSFQTRWGTFTDPWNHLTQPRTGFVVMGTLGTIASYDYDPHVTLQDADHLEGQVIPADTLTPQVSTGLAAVLHHLETGAPLDAPISTAIGRTGQLMVDAAVLSAESGRRVEVTREGVRP